jgi:hypothetical protein
VRRRLQALIDGTHGAASTGAPTTTSVTYPHLRRLGPAILAGGNDYLALPRLAMGRRRSAADLGSRRGVEPRVPRSNRPGVNRPSLRRRAGPGHGNSERRDTIGGLSRPAAVWNLQPFRT